MNSRSTDPGLLDSIESERAERLARRTDPESSHQAARKSLKRALPMTHAERILGTMWRTMTMSDLERLTGLTRVQIDRRRHELVKLGLITLGTVADDGCQRWIPDPAAFLRWQRGEIKLGAP